VEVTNETYHMQVAPLALQEVSLAKDYMHLPTTTAFGTAAQPFQTWKRIP